MRAHLPVALALSVLAVYAAGCATEETTTSPAPAKKDIETPAASETKTETTASALEATSCRFLIPKSAEGSKIVCYDLTVRESRRAGAADKTIKIHVARIKGKEGGVPTIELLGGPGGGGDGMIGPLVAGVKDLTDAYGPLLAKGDLVVFDQRGVGRSVPRLACAMDGPDGTSTCKKDLEAKGIDLSAYDTVENADDVHDLKVGLGVEKIDLHGISYGTRLALEVLKRHPDDVRSAIIDGVMPPDVPVLGMFPVALDTILSRTFDACKADAKCNATYPDLDGQMTALKAKLDKTPFTAHDFQFGEDYPYDWSAFVEDLIGKSYTEGTAAHVPHWIHALLTQTQEEFTAAAKKADDEEAAKFAADDAASATNPLLAEYLEVMRSASEADYAAMDMAQGMYLSVTCNDYAQHEDLAAAKAAQAKIRKVLQDDVALESEFEDCKIWPKRASEPTVQAPARYAGPVLVIGGDQDPATPVEWAKHAASTLSESAFIEVPTGGHGLMDACGAGLKGAFFGDPGKKLDATCATDRKLDFYYDAPSTKFRAISRTSASAFVPSRPAATLGDRLAERVLAASKPAIVNETAKAMLKLAGRR